MSRIVCLLQLLFLCSCTARTQIARRDVFLPPGDAAAGQAAFVALKCSSCHRVAGVETLPTPTTNKAVITLAGPSNSRPTDGAMITAIIHPNQMVSRHYVEGVASEDGSTRMPDFSETMSVRQLIDLIAFLRDPAASADQ